MTSAPVRLRLQVLPGDYAVCRLHPDASLPVWAMQGEFWTVSRTHDELSILCATELVPDNFEAQSGGQLQKGWAALKLQGPFEFTLTGILTSVLNPLKEAGIGIFAISTFDTDYVLVAQAHLQATIEALRLAGHEVLSAAN